LAVIYALRGVKVLRTALALKRRVEGLNDVARMFILDNIAHQKKKTRCLQKKVQKKGKK
jgi:glycerol-3-phosphate responsive antiterminator